MRRALVVVFLAAAASVAQGQAPPAAASDSSDRPIQDNSFLVEEAYNQEPGVVQHINLFQRDTRSGAWSAAFTQEYPVPGIRHQLSYTVPYQRLASDGTATGLGDVAVNYRYQLLGDGDAVVAVAPRLTVLLPTGDDRRGLGSGSTGVQVSLPVSTVLAPTWVAHWNAGATIVPSARDERGDKARTVGYNFAGSVIWLGKSFNILVETVWSSAETVARAGSTDRTTTWLVNPGVRWAYNFASGLQIVPGLGFPIGLGSSRGQYSILLYLSFEHRFWTGKSPS